MMKSVMNVVFCIALFCYTAGVGAGRCCSFKLSFKSVYDALLNLPTKPATIFCESPYVWETCQNSSSCYSFNLRTVVPVFGLSGSRNLGSCTITPAYIDGLIRDFPVFNYSLEPGIFTPDLANVSLSPKSGSSQYRPTPKTGKRRTWQGLVGFPEPPPPRVEHTLFAVQSRVYVFGGKTSSGPGNELYFFDSSIQSWTDLTGRTGGSTPEPRSNAAAVLCGTDHIILFGGDSLAGPLADLHNFDASIFTWTSLNTAVSGQSPSARHSHGMACVGRKVYLFGGFSSTALNDMHMLDLDSMTWNELTPLASGTPSPRSGHGMATLGNSIYLFGGRSPDQGPMSDIYVFDPIGLQWATLTSAFRASGSGPNGRDKTSLVSAGGFLFVLGGDSRQFDIWKVDVHRMEWYNIEEIMGNHLPDSTAISCALGSWIYIFGGSSNLMYKLNGQTFAWSFYTGTFRGTIPSMRIWSPLVEAFGRVFVFSGATQQGGFIGNDLYAFDPVDLVWENLTSISQGLPQGRSRHALASIKQNVFLYGGMVLDSAGDSKILGDLHVMDAISLNWTELIIPGLKPGSRHSHGFASFGDNLFLFGGVVSQNLNDDFPRDLYVLNLGVASPQWTVLSETFDNLPPPRFGHGMTSISSKLYVFGGQGKEGRRNDLYEYDINLARWTQLTSKFTDELPSGRSYFGFTSDSENLYVFGGIGEDGDLNDWNAIDLRAGSVRELGFDLNARIGSSMLLSAGKMLLFGGTSSSYGSTISDIFHFIIMPRRQLWPSGGNSLGFLDIYDWDTVVGQDASILHNVVLCSGVVPCSLELVGDPRGRMRRKRDVSIICSAENGCSKLEVKSIDFECAEDGVDEGQTVSLLQVWSADVHLFDSSFTGCISATDGGVLSMNLDSLVQILACQFRGCRSRNYGGAIAMVGGFLNVQDSHFIDCEADSGGGAIWTSTLSCYWSQESAYFSAVLVNSSSFTGCRTVLSGGAVLASSEATDKDTPGASVQVSVVGSVFKGGRAGGNGGAIAASGLAVSVALQGCLFQELLSNSTGGAFSGVFSSLSAINCTFLGCRAVQGGGAVGTTLGGVGRAYKASKLKTISSVAVNVSNSSFFDCFSNGAGGALAASSKDSAAITGIIMKIEGSHFNDCATAGNGGGVFLSGNRIKAVLDGCFFAGCRADVSGGAMSLEDAAEANLSRSILRNNTAVLAGGGVHARGAVLEILAVAATANRALSGGGGVLMWTGEILSNVAVANPLQLDCVAGNAAPYGACVASSFSSLELGPLSPQSFAGLAVSLHVLKRDVYGQTIATDSSSLVQAMLVDGSAASLTGGIVFRLRGGQANFTLTIRPKIASVDFETLTAFLVVMPRVLLRGIDAEDSSVVMQSGGRTVILGEGVKVCPSGHLLITDDSGFALCSRCGAGTYVLSALASSCIGCPPDSQCDGSPRVNFSLGVWEAGRTFYRLVACPRNHQLVDSLGGSFNPSVQHCRPCLPGQTNLNPNSSQFSCYAWQFSSYVRLVVTLPLAPTDFSDSARLNFSLAVAATARASLRDIVVSEPSPADGRRAVAAATALEAKVGITNSSLDVLTPLRDGSTLPRELAARGLPSPVSLSASLILESGDDNKVPLAVGVSLAGFVSAIGLLGVAAWFGLKLYKNAAYETLVAACQACQPGDDATAQHLPLALRPHYVPVRVVGKGAFGCVVNARSRKTKTPVAIKLILPAKAKLDQAEERRVRREGAVLRLLTDLRCDTAVHLVGADAVHVGPDVCWLVMELLDGDNLGDLVQVNDNLFDDMECVRVAQSVLAALKVMHAEGLIHGDIKPANVMRCIHGFDVSVAKRSSAAGKAEAVYKLIDFGTTLGVDESIAKVEMMTITDLRDLGVGTPPYMSPEMFNDPSTASYPTDLWSLGVTLFEIATHRRPFEAQGGQLAAWAQAVACDLDERAPDLLDMLDGDRRSAFDGNLAGVVARALEKDVKQRYSTADEMHQAVYRCLVVRGEAFYREESDEPLARLLFDELNHSITPGGHRVTVYWDAHRQAKGEPWEQGLGMGLLNSLCCFPIFSYGSTAPMARLASSSLAAEVWPVRPLGLERLNGNESDREDSVLKEWLMARTLLKRGNAEAGKLLSGERRILQAVYPIFVGRPHPPNHPEYPNMGTFFAVRGGGGQFPSTPSPATVCAVCQFLKDKAGLPEDALSAAKQCSVEAVAMGMTRLQGCMLWKNSAGLQEARLTKEQEALVGCGYCGPPVDVGGPLLTAAQKAACSGGLDGRQLRMLKAQVREKKVDFHEIIDRAVVSQTRAAKSLSATTLSQSAKGAPGTAVLESRGGMDSSGAGSELGWRDGGAEARSEGTGESMGLARARGEAKVVLADLVCPQNP